jgi:hypothetical protein
VTEEREGEEGEKVIIGLDATPVPAVICLYRIGLYEE